jgi:hypothetical protein
VKGHSSLTTTIEKPQKAYFTQRTQRRRERQTGESLSLIHSVLGESENVNSRERLSAPLRSLRETVFGWILQSRRVERKVSVKEYDEFLRKCNLVGARRSPTVASVPEENEPLSRPDCHWSICCTRTTPPIKILHDEISTGRFRL